jgi:hypothetical protein
MWRKIERALEDHLRREGWAFDAGFAVMFSHRDEDGVVEVAIDLARLAKAIEDDLK